MSLKKQQIENFKNSRQKPQPSRYVFVVLKAAKTMSSTRKSKADVENFACCETCMWETYAIMSMYINGLQSFRKKVQRVFKVFSK